METKQDIINYLDKYATNLRAFMDQEKESLSAQESLGLFGEISRIDKRIEKLKSKQ